MPKLSRLKSALVGSAGIALTALAPMVSAQSLPVECPGYERPKTQLLGERAGKKLQKAFEAYNQDLVDEAINLLYEIEAKEPFDRASVDKFLGQILAGQDGKQKEALDYLRRSVQTKVLNDGDHASIMKAVGDLSLNDDNSKDAIMWYQRWMDFTCKEDPQVYMRMAKAYLDLKQYKNVIGPIDNAIRLFKEPKVNAYRIKISAHYEDKDMPNTIKTAETALQVFPTEKSFWRQLGMFYLVEERYSEALATFELAYKQGYLTKKNEINVLSQLYSTQGVPIKAAEFQEKYLKSGLLEKDEQTLSSLANLYNRAREFKKAASYYAQAAVINNNPEYYQKQGEMLLTAEEYKRAIPALEKALAYNTDKEGRVNYSLMEANFYSNNFKEAYKYVQAAKKDNSIRRNALAWEPYIKEKAKNRGIRL